jgi:hypothetical protein
MQGMQPCISHLVQIENHFDYFCQHNKLLIPLVARSKFCCDAADHRYLDGTKIGQIKAVKTLWSKL